MWELFFSRIKGIKNSRAALGKLGSMRKEALKVRTIKSLSKRLRSTRSEEAVKAQKQVSEEFFKVGGFREDLPERKFFV